MIVWYNKKRYVVDPADQSIAIDALVHLTSVDDTVARYIVVPSRKIEWSDPGPDYWDRRDNKLGLQTGVQ